MTSPKSTRRRIGSKWDRVVPDPAVAVAAIDRLVHHGTILEMNADSYRRRSAATRINNSSPEAPVASDNLIDNRNRERTDAPT